MRPLNAILLTAGLTASLAWAQPPATPGPAADVQEHVNFLSTLLSLTSAQRQQAATFLTTAATATTPLEQSLDRAQQSLRRAVRISDQNGIQHFAATVGAITGQLAAAEAQADASFYQILSPQQRTKLDQFESQNEGGFGKGAGPGGVPGRPH